MTYTKTAVLPIPPDEAFALITEPERLRRHECAIAFDWLAGNRERAMTAATILSQSSETFRKRWREISAGLPN